MRLFIFGASLFCLMGPGSAGAMEDSDIPTEPVQDAVMPGLSDKQAMVDWARRAFSAQPITDPHSAIQIEVLRQDYSVLQQGRSCIETPIRIGDQHFTHGLGTHANSEILLRLPRGAKTFSSCVGIDHNPDTEGLRGTVQFSVEIGGKEVLRTPTVKGGDAPVPVKIELPPNTPEIILKVDTTADGPAHDQADWADARIIMEDGSESWIDQKSQSFMTDQLPISFVYDGIASADLLKNWNAISETRKNANQMIYTTRWTDARTGLCLRVEATVWEPYAAVEWLIHFENTGNQDTPILENVQAIDIQLRTGYTHKPVILHQITGDVCGEKTFLPLETTLEPGKPAVFAPVGGRSSNGTFPFFNLQYGDEGMITAIGWSGQWAAQLVRSATGPTRLQAGMEKTHFLLHPGEQVRGPRILVMPWKGDRTTAHNRFRRLLLFEYVPKIHGRPLRLPVAAQCFDRYSWTRPEWSTEAGQIHAAKVTRQLGCDTHWLDAAWFEGGFPNGVGNWYCKPKGFPHGLKPVSDACHQAGLQFLLWFEPERVAPGTQIAREHPEFVHGGKEGGLFKLDDPAARKWLTELLSQRITDFGLDVYRNDFNMDPLNYWRASDAPDRQGITEIRYVEGHYAMWDQLRAGHPGLWIDDCSSGGRRIDLETLSRSVPLWRSDTGCSPGHADWDQVQTLGLSPYVPLSTSCAWEPKAYVLRSAATGGSITQFDYLNDQFPMDQARAALAEIKDNQKYWYGDFYPLSRSLLGPDAFVAWQLHRPDLDSGIVLAFRRADCPYPVLQTNLRGINSERLYRVEFIDETRALQTKTMSGRELQTDFELRIPNRSESHLIRYQPISAQNK